MVDSGKNFLLHLCFGVTERISDFYTLRRFHRVCDFVHVYVIFLLC